MATHNDELYSTVKFCRIAYLGTDYKSAKIRCNRFWQFHIYCSDILLAQRQSSLESKVSSFVFIKLDSLLLAFEIGYFLQMHLDE